MPKNLEEEYFAREEYERKSTKEKEKVKQMETEEKQRIKDLHYMHCPKCGMTLIELDYKTIKIDKCSSCKGIWLDDGELEAIVQKEEKVMESFFKLFKL